MKEGLRWSFGSPGCLKGGCHKNRVAVLHLAGWIRVFGAGRNGGDTWGTVWADAWNDSCQSQAHTLPVGLLFPWDPDLSKHLASGFFVCLFWSQTHQPSHEQTDSRIILVPTFKCLWPLTLLSFFQRAFWGKCWTVSPWANLYDVGASVAMHNALGEDQGKSKLLKR